MTTTVYAICLPSQCMYKCCSSGECGDWYQCNMTLLLAIILGGGTLTSLISISILRSLYIERSLNRILSTISVASESKEDYYSSKVENLSLCSDNSNVSILQNELSKAKLDKGQKFIKKNKIVSTAANTNAMSNRPNKNKDKRNGPFMKESNNPDVYNPSTVPVALNDMEEHKKYNKERKNDNTKNKQGKDKVTGHHSNSSLNPPRLHLAAENKKPKHIEIIDISPFDNDRQSNQFENEESLSNYEIGELPPELVEKAKKLISKSTIQVGSHSPYKKTHI